MLSTVFNFINDIFAYLPINHVHIEFTYNIPPNTGTNLQVGFEIDLDRFVESTSSTSQDKKQPEIEMSVRPSPIGYLALTAIVVVVI